MTVTHSSFYLFSNHSLVVYQVLHATTRPEEAYCLEAERGKKTIGYSTDFVEAEGRKHGGRAPWLRVGWERLERDDPLLGLKES